MSRITRDEYTGRPLEINDRGVFWQSVVIMETWEKPHIEAYMRRILNDHQPESVLEIGFGLGYTAQVIYDFGVRFFTIVEAHPQIIVDAARWTAGKPGVRLIQGFVEDVDLPAAVDLIWDDRPEVTSYGDDWLTRVRAKHYVKYDPAAMMQMTPDEYQRFQLGGGQLWGGV